MKKLLAILVLGFVLSIPNISYDYEKFCNLRIGTNVFAYSGLCSKAPGGDCYNGIGGPCYAGIGGPAYAGIGGPCSKIGQTFTNNCPKPCMCNK